MNRNEVNHNDTKMHSSLLHVLTLLALLVAAAMARLRVTMLDFNSLLTNYLQDDAFYYYKIASNIFSLHRITYDGEQLSNGFHPLWLALITFFYTPANDGVDFVYRVQWIMFFCALLTVVILYLTLKRLRVGWLCSVIVTSVFCVHSTFVAIQINGLETSINTLILLLLFNAFLTVFVDPLSELIHYIYFGIIAAATFFVRTDNGIALLFLFIFLAWSSRKMIIQCWPRLFISGLFVLLMVSPWLLWNQVNFGSVVQGSGKVETIYWGEPRFELMKILYEFLISPYKFYQKMQFFGKIFVYPKNNMWIPVSITIYFFLFSFLFVFKSSLDKKISALGCFFVAIIMVFSYHAGMRDFVRIWYFVPVSIVYIMLPAGVSLCISNYPKLYFLYRFFLIFWLASVFFLYSPWALPGAVIEESPHIVVSSWINENTSEGDVIGSMNSGVLGYITNRKVINLDGVVDHRSMQALWKRTHLAYIHERNISYLVDTDGALAIFCNDNPVHACERVFSFGDSVNPGRVVRIVKK